MELLITLHVLGACVWVGGHLLLALRILPESLRTRNVEMIKSFESKYEVVGMPALLLQVVTGIWLALKYNPDLIGFENGIETAISVKLFLLLGTVLLAINARFFIFPKLTEKNLNYLAAHIILVTLFSLGFLYAGVSVRFGGL